MSDMVKRYLESTSLRVTEAKKIPGVVTDYFGNDFQKGFDINRKHTESDEDTEFTQKALGYYTDESKNIVIPKSFVPLDPKISLHRYTPDKKYYTPGEPGTEGKNDV
jgi:hypothetical protein